MLSSATWQGVDLRDLIRDQLLAGAVDETRITAWGPRVHLEAQLALRAALMLHELGTNAIKYGALSTATGVVTISWSVAGAELRLRWEERGGPVVHAPAKRGFGRTLIEQSAKGEGGDALMSIEAEGVVWNIALPLGRTSADEVSGNRMRQRRGAGCRGHRRERRTQTGRKASFGGGG
jgi:two-component sensor histidine kinase